MDVAALEAELREAGIALSVEGTKLVLEGRRAALSAELVERCRASREDLLDMMQPPVRTKSRWSGPFEQVPGHTQLGRPKPRPRVGIF